MTCNMHASGVDSAGGGHIVRHLYSVLRKHPVVCALPELGVANRVFKVDPLSSNSNKVGASRLIYLSVYAFPIALHS